ncbi:MAG: hypothetical protein K2I03_06590, partial [Lachnospiraceae bacterium]|nr:hypothetical protein [Lachnospiraceae bacterium]
MKYKGLIIGIIVLSVVLLGIWLMTRPETLGNMNHTYTKSTTNKSTISFEGEAGDKVKFSFASNIENGELDIILYDSNGNKVYELDRA